MFGYLLLATKFGMLLCQQPHISAEICGSEAMISLQAFVGELARKTETFFYFCIKIFFNFLKRSSLAFTKACGSVTCARNFHSAIDPAVMARVGSDLRADRQYWPRITYDLTVGPAGSEIRPYQSNRVGCLTLCKSIASTTSSWRAAL